MKNINFLNLEKRIDSILREPEINTLLQKLTDLVYIREKLLLDVEKTILGMTYGNTTISISISEILEHYSITPSDKYTTILE